MKNAFFYKGLSYFLGIPSGDGEGLDGLEKCCTIILLESRDRVFMYILQEKPRTNFFLTFHAIGKIKFYSLKNVQSDDMFSFFFA